MTGSIYQVALEDAKGSIIDLGDSKRYVKQLVKFGKWVDPLNPKNKMSLDKAWAQKVVDNFQKKVVGRIAVPLSHSDLPESNSGELLDLSIQPDGLYGTLDIRDPKTASAIEHDLIWDVSISFDNEYLDKKTGKEVGPALLHVALVNNPYLKGMEPFKALANRMHAIMLSESKENDMATVTVTNDREFDVAVKYTEDGTEKEVILAAGQSQEVPEDQAEATLAQVSSATPPAPEVKPEEEEPKPTEPEPTPEVTPEAEPDADLAKENAALKDQLAKRDAEDSYKTLLSDGKIVPAQRDAYMALATAKTASTISLSDGTTKSLSDLLEDLLKSAPKRVKFSEDGSSDDEEAKTPWDNLSDEERAGNTALGVTKEQFNEVNSATIT